MSVAAKEYDSIEIGKACNLVNGRAFKPTEWETTGLPIVRIQNLNDETKEFNYFNGDYDPKHEVNDGDLLFSWSGTPGTSFGAFFWNRGKALLNQHIFNVHIDKSRIKKRYFRYALNSRLNEIIGHAHGGVGLKHITKGKLEAVAIPLPPLSEQKRIADILDKADAIRRKRQEAVETVQEFPLAAFRHTFADYLDPRRMETVLSDAGEVVSGVAKGRRLNGEVIREVPYLRVANVQAGYLDLTEIKTIPAKQTEIEALSLQQGDVVLTEGGDHDKLGRGALWEQDVPDCIHQNHVFRVRVDRSKLLPTFFVHFLQSRIAKSYFLRCAKKTTNLASINMTQLRALPIPLPPLHLQLQFDGEFRYAMEAYNHHQQARSTAEDVFNSLMQRAFKGEL